MSNNPCATGVVVSDRDASDVIAYPMPFAALTGSAMAVAGVAETPVVAHKQRLWAAAHPRTSGSPPRTPPV